jgi:hypothetical protein
VPKTPNLWKADKNFAGGIYKGWIFLKVLARIQYSLQYFRCKKKL